MLLKKLPRILIFKIRDGSKYSLGTWAGTIDKGENTFFEKKGGEEIYFQK